MAPNDTTSGTSRYDVPDKTTSNNDTLTQDAAGHYYKTSGGEVQPEDLKTKSPSTDTSTHSADSHDPSFAGGSDSDSGGGLLDTILDFFSSS